jgi:diguanylate cyclase (GGDEF)-like protein
VMIDVDFFKPYNDRYGHVAGDDALRQIAEELVTAMHRPADFVARYGGEEFVCLLPETGLEGGIAIAERIQTGIHHRAIPHEGSSVAPVITLSYGVVSEICVQGSSEEALLRAADAYLYEAKSGGRNRIVARERVGGEL